MGNNKSNPTLIVQVDKEFYAPGDAVYGTVYVDAPKPYPCSRIILNILGLQSSWWKGIPPQLRNARKPNQPLPENQQFKGQSKIIETSFVVCAWNNDSVLNGQYAFPFSFRFPNYLPGTFSESKANYRGSIQYNIRCTCISPKPTHKHLEYSQQLVIREPQREAEQMLHGDLFLYPKSCCCKRHGTTKVSCYFEKNYYIPGEQCIAICEVDNFKGSKGISQVRCDLIKKITLNSFMGIQNIFETTINTMHFPGIAPFNMYVGENAARKTISLKYQNSQTSLHPSTSGRLVKCEYFIRVQPIYEGVCVSNITNFSVKLNILQQGLIMPKIEEPVNWQPQMYRMSEIVLNNQGENELISSMIEKS